MARHLGPISRRKRIKDLHRVTFIYHDGTLKESKAAYHWSRVFFGRWYVGQEDLELAKHFRLGTGYTKYSDDLLLIIHCPEWGGEVL